MPLGGAGGVLPPWSTRLHGSNATDVGARVRFAVAPTASASGGCASRHAAANQRRLPDERHLARADFPGSSASRCTACGRADVGCNARSGAHGTVVHDSVVRVHTASGAVGVGWARLERAGAESLVGRRLWGAVPAAGPLAGRGRGDRPAAVGPRRPAAGAPSAATWCAGCCGRATRSAASCFPATPAGRTSWTASPTSNWWRATCATTPPCSGRCGAATPCTISPPPSPRRTTTSSTCRSTGSGPCTCWRRSAPMRPGCTGWCTPAPRRCTGARRMTDACSSARSARTR